MLASCGTPSVSPASNISRRQSSYLKNHTHTTELTLRSTHICKYSYTFKVRKGICVVGCVVHNGLADSQPSPLVPIVRGEIRRRLQSSCCWALVRNCDEQGRYGSAEFRLGRDLYVHCKKRM